jgi:hypothetical protein
MLEQLDDHYKLFVTRYMEFKSNIVDFKNIKQEYIQNTFAQAQFTNQLDYNKVSNANLLKELEDIKNKNKISKAI